jgi:hypothetical protein
MALLVLDMELGERHCLVGINEGTHPPAEGLAAAQNYCPPAEQSTLDMDSGHIPTRPQQFASGKKLQGHRKSPVWYKNDG